MGRCSAVGDDIYRIEGYVPCPYVGPAIAVDLHGLVKGLAGGIQCGMDDQYDPRDDEVRERHTFQPSHPIQ